MPTNFWLETRRGVASRCQQPSSVQTSTRPKQGAIGQSFGPRCCTKMTYMHICMKSHFWQQIISTPLQVKGAFTNRKYFPPPSKKFHVYSERSVFSVQTSQIKSGKKKSGFLTMKGFRPWLWRIGTDILATTHLNLLTSKFPNKKHSSRKLFC